MKPRARRVTIAAAVLGAGVVGVAVVLNWTAVRDHVEGWRFQLTRQTVIISPEYGRTRDLFGVVAVFSGVSVVLG
jgi:hypothetical protein